ncbi:hypothetical protein [Bradyrhizobium sp. NFR13]|uniref:hypothetical protein n=1 Tax=Bradyrhizobium sp. NFR13 TaxID=1566285 RepID=UPI0011141281|nr:hypothetical protein [Bradyrhizobium sp. NFR13]
MCLLDLEIGYAHDTSRWQAQGMRATATGTVDFTGRRITDLERIGAPGDFMRQPHFSGGAWRFCAVHTGATERLVDLFRTTSFPQQRPATHSTPFANSWRLDENHARPTQLSASVLIITPPGPSVSRRSAARSIARFRAQPALAISDGNSSSMTSTLCGTDSAKRLATAEVTVSAIIGEHQDLERVRGKGRAETVALDGQRSDTPLDPVGFVAGRNGDDRERLDVRIHKAERPGIGRLLIARFDACSLSWAAAATLSRAWREGLSMFQVVSLSRF